MKLAYVTEYNAADLHQWSGLGYHISQALRDQGVHIDCIGPLAVRHRFWHLGKKIAYHAYRKRYIPDVQPEVARYFADQVARQIDLLNPDIVFCPGTRPIAYLQCAQPIISWCDSSFGGLVDFYPEFSHLCRETLHNGNELEKRALANCHTAVYSSRWAADTARNLYRVDPGKIQTLPLAANLSSPPSHQAIEASIRTRSPHECSLLFIGVDWDRKGGPIALEVARCLNKQGLMSRLHIVGVIPPEPMPDFVTVHGFMSKAREHDRARLGNLLASSHFLILPTKAECFGLVFAEASAHGLPSLATNVGGISDVVRDGINGQLFPLETAPTEYASCITNLMRDQDRYRQLATSALNDYHSRLNWDVVGRGLKDILEQALAQPKPARPEPALAAL